ncbi:MAG: hypothetical protein GX552_10525 [Chloroflexi bacterium]|nr:hypothetical protein [Chloroflexota bacterium]
MASSVEEALAYLTVNRGEAQLVAGGTDLLPRLEAGDLLFEHLVDVSRVAAMKRIEQENGYLIIGGSVTFAALQEEALVRERVPLLWEAARQMGTPEVRQAATLAGNVVTAYGNADGAVALVALDAEVEITNMTGSQWLPIGALFVRSGVSRVDSTSEIVTAVRLGGLGPDQGMALERVAPRQPGERAPLVLAMVLAVDREANVVDWASVAAGAADTVPFRFAGLEELLGGLHLDDVRTREMLPNLVHDRVIASGMFNDALVSHQDVEALGRRAFRRALAMALGESESPCNNGH